LQTRVTNHAYINLPAINVLFGDRMGFRLTVNELDALGQFGVKHIDMMLRPEKLWRIIHGGQA